MNQGRIWCVVNPSVGLPLLLGSVAVTSLIVHASVMTHTTWMSSYWDGSWRNRAPARVSDATTHAAPAFAVTVTPAQPGTSETSFVVTVTPAPGATPTLAVDDASASRPPGPLASASPPAE